MRCPRAEKQADRRTAVHRGTNRQESPAKRIRDVASQEPPPSRAPPGGRFQPLDDGTSTYRTATVTPGWLASPPTLTVTGTAPEATPAGSFALIWTTPATSPGAGPA